ncbi:MAG: J domain-containing protein [Capsulimonadales bacterium]|nr:J domain-containing protein [Capsulimonadales bacterium]
MPETPEKNAYEVLGVARTASLDDIKKRYRELARQHHPDVNQGNPTAAKTFALVTNAYKTLSDSGSRATYDAELTLQEKRRSEAAKRSAAPTTGASGPTASTVRPPAASAAENAQRNQAASQRSVTEAQAAFARGRFVEARSHAEQALRLNRRNDKAYEVLGDVFARQGKTDEAINMYSMALQLNPRNPPLMQRLERLTRTTGSGPGPNAQRVFFDNSPGPAPRPQATPGRPPVSPPIGRVNPAPSAYRSPVTASGMPRRDLGIITVGFIGYTGVLLTVIYTALFPGAAPVAGSFLPMVSSWNGTIWTVLPLSGMMLGFTMTLTGAIRRLEDELVFNGVPSGGGAVLPMGLLVIVLAAINFYIAAIVYSIVGLLQESFTKSMARVLGAVLILVTILALVYSPGAMQVFVWGGNVVFLCFVIGWLIGDVFRPESV